MKSSEFILERVRNLTADTFELTFSGDTSGITAAGQFVNVALSGFFLRRPISVCDWSENRLVLLIRTVGAGTRELASAALGTRFDILTGLGNGFDLSILEPRPVTSDVLPSLNSQEDAREEMSFSRPESDVPPSLKGKGDRGKGFQVIPPERVILAGGGIGIAPLYGLAKRLARQGATPVAALGFRNARDVFYLDEFRAIGCEVSAATEDGSLGMRGLVTDVLQQYPTRDYVFCCGPLPMLRAVGGLSHLRGGQYSFEARMGCGFGACMGCSMPFRDGMKRVCKDGPVFLREEIAWERL